MDFAKIKITGGPLVLASDADVENAALSLGITVPKGYREYVTTLGEGVLEVYVRVYPPWRIVAELEEWRDRIRQYWFWDEGADVMTDEQAEESIIIADTLGGDEVIFHPLRPDRVVVLPHDNKTIFEAGTNLMEAIDWLCNSGQLVRPIKPKYFEPFDSRLLERKKWIKPKRQIISDDSAMQNPLQLPTTQLVITSSPDEFLQEFFIALERWEVIASQAMRDFHKMTEAGNYSDFVDSWKDKLYAITFPFVSDNFDIGEPQSFCGSGTYGRNGPRILNVQIVDGIAEIETFGNNILIGDRSFDNTTRLFRLIQQNNSWQVDGLWEITKTGRRKRIKLF